MYIKEGSDYMLSKEYGEHKYVLTDSSSVTGQQVEDLVVTGLEGSVGYWACLDNGGPEWEDQPEDMPTSLYATQLLISGASLNFLDTDAEEDEQWELNLTKLLSGVTMAEANLDHFDIDDIDGIMADCIFQYALFGEIRFS